MPMYPLDSQMQEKKERSLSSIQGLGQAGSEDKYRLNLHGCAKGKPITPTPTPELG